MCIFALASLAALFDKIARFHNRGLNLTCRKPHLGGVARPGHITLDPKWDWPRPANRAIVCVIRAG
jgi:hypothetical protein